MGRVGAPQIWWAAVLGGLLILAGCSGAAQQPAKRSAPGPTATAAAISGDDLPDPKRLLGMAEDEVRAIYGEPREVIPTTVATDSRRVGDYSLYYRDKSWGQLTVHFNSHGIANGFMVGFLPPKGSVSAVLREFDLPTGQRPTTSAPARSSWSNLGGYMVDVGLEVEHPPGGAPRATGKAPTISIRERP
jgi:hypothetical protein